MSAWYSYGARSAFGVTKIGLLVLAQPHERTLQRVGALAQVPRLHVRLDHAGRELALCRLRHLKLQASAVAVAVVAALPLHARRRKLGLDKFDRNVARVGAVRVSAAAEGDLEGEGVGHLRRAR